MSHLHWHRGVDRIAVACFIAKATVAYFDHVDPAVDALRGAIASLQDDGVKNTTEMLLDGLGNLLDGFQAAIEPIKPSDHGARQEGDIPSTPASDRWP